MNEQHDDDTPQFEEVGEIEIAPPMEITPFEEYVSTQNDREWSIDCILPAGSLTILNGPSGVGKTKFALACARAVATGRPFLDQFSEKGKILYLNLDRMHRGDVLDRVKDLCQGDTLEPWVKEIYFYEGELDLFSPLPNATPEWDDETDKLKVDTKIDFLTALCGAYNLVVVDTLHKMAVDAGLAEKDADEMDKLMIALRNIARESGTAMLLLHHTPVNDQYRSRGSGAITASADHVLSLTVANKGDSIKTRLKLQCTKTRTDRIQIFPVYIAEQIELSLYEEEEMGEPIGAWKGLIEQRIKVYTDKEKKKKMACDRFERWMRVNGEMVGDHKRSAQRKTLMKLVQNKRTLDMIRTHFKKQGRLEVGGGSNPVYTLEF